MTGTVRSLAAAAALSLVALTAPASDTSSGAKPPARKADAAKSSDAPVVFTNDDLAARYGPAPAHKPAPAPAAAAEATPPEPAPQGKNVEAPPAEVVAQREFLVAELERLRRREMSLRNPLLPREPPTDAEAAREEGLDNAERLAVVQAQIRTTAEQLAAIDARWGTIGRANPHAGRP